MGEVIHVRRLRLQASRQITSGAVSACIEDALHCASLPVGWRGRIVLLRRLRLRADARASAQQLSRQIEAQWQAAAVRAVPAARISRTVRSKYAYTRAMAGSFRRT